MRLCAKSVCINLKLCNAVSSAYDANRLSQDEDNILVGDDTGIGEEEVCGGQVEERYRADDCKG